MRTAVKVLNILEIVFGFFYIIPIIFAAISLSAIGKEKKPHIAISILNIIFGNIFGIAGGIVALCAKPEDFIKNPVTTPAVTPSADGSASM